MNAQTAAPQVILLTLLALVAFAANSVIARLAMETGDIGPWSYTTIRLFAGVVILVLFAGLRQTLDNGSWRSAVSLFVYAICFSVAYLSLSAGMGALILFAAVQITMITAGIINAERLGFSQQIGAFAAAGGLIYLLNPGTDAPSLFGAFLMTISGIGWGIYSLRGRSTSNPTRDTAGNFARAALIAAILFVPAIMLSPESSPTRFGVGLAVLSGAVTSGLGYIIWYRALRFLTAIQAGISQLTVPAIAAAGGIVFLSEPLSWRFVIASIIILAGVALATIAPQNSPRT